MQRWTRKARNIDEASKFAGSPVVYTKQMQQSLIFAKALEVARKGGKNLANYDIVMKYLILAER